MATRYTREDYLNGKINHHDYYSQFVDNEILHIVGKYKDILSIDSDNMVQGLELRYWDAMAYSVPPRIILAIKQANGYGVSLSDRICTLKAAARILLKSNVS